MTQTPLKLFNSLTRELEEFTPVHEGEGAHVADVPGWDPAAWVTKRGKAGGRKGGGKYQLTHRVIPPFEKRSQ